MIKIKESWLPKNRLLLKQLLVSTASFITLPFYKPSPDGIRRFFQANYCETPDELIFDGATLGYLKKIDSIIDLSILNDRVIFDIGCGKGTLLKWLQDKNIKFVKYIGLDFAAVPENVCENVEFILDDALNVSKYNKPYQNQISFMINSACYFNACLLRKVLQGLRMGDEIIIIEPSPNVFWDAHFNGVKPIYRRIDELEKILQIEKFEILKDVQDYTLVFSENYFFPLSYGIYAKKTRCED